MTIRSVYRKHFLRKLSACVTVGFSLAIVCMSSVLPVQASGVAVDASVSKDNNTKATSITSPSFSTSASNELLLAFISADSSSGGMQATGITGGGLTWTLVKRANGQLGTAEIWRAFSPSTLSNVSITATLAQKVASSMTVMTFSGVDSANPVGSSVAASAPSGAPTVTLTATTVGSLVVGVGNDWDNPINRTVPSDQTLIHQFKPSVGDTYWVQRRNTLTANAGASATINDTAPTGDRWNLVAVEVVPPTVTDTTPPSVYMTAPSDGAAVSGVVTISAGAFDNVGIAGVQFTLDGSNLGPEDTASPYSISWNTAAASNGPHTLAAIARDAAGNTTTAASVNITVNNAPADTTAPSAPAALSAIGSTGAVSLSWSASTDNVGVSGYNIYRSAVSGFVPSASTKIGQTANLSYNDSVASGTYYYVVTAYDAAGNESSPSNQASGTSTSDTIPPSVSMAAPSDGSTVSGTVTVSAAASDDVGVVGVQFQLDGSNLGAEVTAAPYQLVWDTATASLGTHTLAAVARDAAANTATAASVTVTVTPPQVFTISGTITPAADGAGTMVTLSGSANASTTADANGNYAFDGLQNGSYTVTPTKQPLTFTPAHQSVTINGSDATGINFTASSDPSVIFYDDFNGTSLSSDWTVISRHGEYSQNETECNTPGAVTVYNGNLDIKTTAQSAVCGDYHPDGTVWHTPSSWPYTTGDVQWSNFHFKYGTVEIRAKFPSQNTGTWPATWLLTSNCQATNPLTGETGVGSCPGIGGNGYTEIDMTEYTWGMLNVANPNFVCDTNYSPPLDGNWHTFKTIWTSSSVKQYVDGSLKATCNQSLNNPMFLIMQTQTGGAGGTPNNSALPADLLVDYVKVTQP